LVSSCSLFTICKKKHQVATIDELLEIQAQLENSVFELGNLEGNKRSDSCDSGKIILLDRQASIHDRSDSDFVSKNGCYSGYIRMPNVRFDIQVKLSETYYKLVKMKFNFYLRQIKELGY
jgi:DNA repair protein RecN (Recombination protein N)